MCDIHQKLIYHIMSRDDKVTLTVIRGKFLLRYNKTANFWYLVPSRSWNFYILVGQEWCTGDDEDQVKRVFERSIANGCDGLFPHNKWWQALNYALRLDFILEETEYGVQKRPKVSTIDMVTGNTTFGHDIRRLSFSSDEFLPLYSRIMFTNTGHGEYMCGLKHGSSEDVSNAIITRNKRNALLHCLEMMDKYPTMGVTST